ncbi:MAG: endonuclease/exonuclease/phosphatase family protein [Opitutaceae bacterium]
MRRLTVLCLGLFSQFAHPADATVRVATFNASLNRAEEGQLIRDLSVPGNDQAQKVAAILQRVRPDIVLINEFDHDPDGIALAGFQTHYLGIGQGGEEPIDYPYHFAAAVNTGVPTGVDLNGDGKLTPGNDSFGWGVFPGQYGMVVLSRYPIDLEGIRTFQNFLWKDMPGALLPVDPESGYSFYSEAALAVLRLSSKSHWDLPVRIDDRVVHLLVSHPTPPVFDGPEDRNGKRNHDEIRFWADYLTPGRDTYIRDDLGGAGGLAEGADFVILGDMNADPFDGDSVNDAIGRLLEHPRVMRGIAPRSGGAVEAADEQRRANESHRGDPAFDTADFPDAHSGNLRVDYVLPSVGLEVEASGVFWPRREEPESAWTEVSDHHLVWVDLDLGD